MKHRLVVLGSLYENIELVELAKKRGYYTIVCDNNHDGPAKQRADKAYDVDIYDVDALVRICKSEEVDGIIGSFSDIIFEQITKIADRAGIRWYMTPDRLDYYRDKHEQKKLLSDIGVRVPTYKEADRDSFIEAAKGMSYPCVVKPVSGWGSKGISVLESEADVDKLHAEMVGSSDYDGMKLEIEEYITASEFNLTSWVTDGRVHIIGLADREKTIRPNGGIPEVRRIVYPSKRIDAVIDKAKKVLEGFIEKTGQVEGPLSMQFFYYQDEIVVCEIAGRIFGYEHELITYCSGLSIEELLLDYVYEDKTSIETLIKDHNPRFDKIRAGLYFFGRPGLTIADQSSIDSIRAYPYVLMAQAFYQEGETVSKHEQPYYVRFDIEASSYEELDIRSEDIVHDLSAKSSDGEEIIIKDELEAL